MIEFKGSDIRMRTGSWNGLTTVGYPSPTPLLIRKFVVNEKEVYYEYEIIKRTMFIVSKLTPSGITQSFSWTNQTSTPQVVQNGEKDQCENYAFCGANSICIYDDNYLTCECLRGYVPKSPDEWNIRIWFDGCILRNKSDCKISYTDGFLKYSHLKLPDTSSSWFSKTMNLDECHKSCLENCSCKAYANLDIRNGGSGCLLWYNTLLDLRKFSESGLSYPIFDPFFNSFFSRLLSQKFSSFQTKFRQGGILKYLIFVSKTTPFFYLFMYLFFLLLLLFLVIIFFFFSFY